MLEKVGEIGIIMHVQGSCYIIVIFIIMTALEEANLPGSEIM